MHVSPLIVAAFKNRSFAEANRVLGWRNPPPELVGAIDHQHLRSEIARLSDPPEAAAPPLTATSPQVSARVTLETDEDFRRYDPQLWRNSLHEAAHVVLLLDAGVRVTRARAGRTADGGWATFLGSVKPYRDCVISLAGIAVNEWCNQRPERENASDWEQARAAADRHVSHFAYEDNATKQSAVKGVLYDAKDEATEEVGRHWGKIRAIARTLFWNEGRDVEEEELLHIFNN